jgi:ornithine decarboxylase
MTARIHEFLRNRVEDGPCLVVDLEVVHDNYKAFANALPDTRVFYAVKANPRRRCRRCSPVSRLVLRHRVGGRDRDGAGGGRHARPHLLWQHHQEGARHRPRLALGVRLFAVDCRAEVEKIARAALRRAGVLPFLLRLRRRRKWPLSRKFGCDTAMAVDARASPIAWVLEAHGVSFHVGSQQRRTQAWDLA